jgi:hypothetical protein
VLGAWYSSPCRKCLAQQPGQGVLGTATRCSERVIPQHMRRRNRVIHQTVRSAKPCPLLRCWLQDLESFYATAEEVDLPWMERAEEAGSADGAGSPVWSTKQ